MAPFPAYILDAGSLAKGQRGEARDGRVSGGWEGGLIMADERVQPIGERLFGLRSEILTCIRPSQIS